MPRWPIKAAKEEMERQMTEELPNPQEEMSKKPKSLIEVVSEMPADPLAEKKLLADEAEKEKLRKEVEELRAKLAAMDERPLEVAMKDPYFGTTMYLRVNLQEYEDPKNPKLTIYVPGALSVFPDAIIPGTNGEPLAPDIGFDSREQADALRNSDTAKCSYKGKKDTLIKDAIADLRRDYYERRKAADKKYLGSPDLKEAGLNQ